MAQKKKHEYAFIIQGDMTPFQRKVLAQYLMNKASQLKCGLACNYHEDGRYEELTWEEMMDGKNHPKTEE